MQQCLQLRETVQLGAVLGVVQVRVDLEPKLSHQLLREPWRGKQLASSAVREQHTSATLYMNSWKTTIETCNDEANRMSITQHSMPQPHWNASDTCSSCEKSALSSRSISS